VTCPHGWMMGSALVHRPPCPHCLEETVARLTAELAAMLEERDEACRLLTILATDGTDDDAVEAIEFLTRQTGTAK
jgi:hypothetical protein